MPELRRELLARMERDQEIHQRRVAERADGAADQPIAIDPAIVGELMKVDRENRLWLAERIEKHGWPGRSLVGTDGAHAAWLLVSARRSGRRVSAVLSGLDDGGRHQPGQTLRHCLSD
jgi:hypothetical protein